VLVGRSIVIGEVLLIELVRHTSASLALVELRLKHMLLRVVAQGTSKTHVLMSVTDIIADLLVFLHLLKLIEVLSCAFYRVFSLVIVNAFHTSL
jgi:hypothetical protein